MIEKEWEKWFSHNVASVVFTRFGIGVADEAWFDYRLMLLEKVALSSVLNQSFLPFRWMILVDEVMPERYRAQLDRIMSVHEFVDVVPVRRLLEGRYMDLIFSYLKESGKSYLAIARADDDDAIDKDCWSLIARMTYDGHQLLDDGAADSLGFYFPIGYRYLPTHSLFVPTGNRVPIAIHLGMVSRAEQPVTAFGGHHDFEAGARAARRVTFGLGVNRPCWLHTINKLSDSTRLQGVERLKNSSERFTPGPEVLDRFGLDEKTLAFVQSADERAAEGLYYRENHIYNKSLQELQKIELELRDLETKLAAAVEGERSDLDEKIRELKWKRMNGRKMTSSDLAG